jgi:hypothetical protein
VQKFQQLRVLLYNDVVVFTRNLCILQFKLLTCFPTDLSKYNQQHVRIYKTVKFLQLIFNLNYFDMKGRFDWGYLIASLLVTISGALKTTKAL